uniref:Putative secreted protein n=1 Tax=Ixodes ricinus TaxID=34613 RepID=V5H4R9_IXORI
MYRNISNMLVLFAVVLILPAISGEGLTSSFWGCFHALRPGATIYCKLSGYSYCTHIFFETGELQCRGGTNRLKLPESVWPNGSSRSSCTEEVKTRLQHFTDEMTKKKSDLVKIWCPAA